MRSLQVDYLKGLLFFIGIGLITISNPLYALGTCSDYKGQAVLNEFYHSNQSLSPTNYFVEAKALNYDLVTDSTYQGWSVTLCSQQAADDGAIECISGDSALAAANANTDYVAGLSLASASWPSGTNSWIVVDQADWTNDHGYIDLQAGAGHGMEVLLLDANGDLIDYLSVDGYTKHIGTSFASTCSLTQVTYDGGSNTFDIQRVPDGTGPWDKNPGNSGDETTTTTNDVLPDPPPGSSYPEITVKDTNTYAGDPATFTITFADQDGDGFADTFTQNVTINYSTIDGTATAGSDYTAISSGSITIPAGATFATISVNTFISADGGENFYLYLESIEPSIENGGEVNAIINDHFGKATFVPPPVAYYPLDESVWGGVPDEVLDSSDNGLDGTSTSASTSSGMVCNAGDFAGASDNVTIANDPAFDFTTGMTLSAWLYIDTSASFDGQIIKKGTNFDISINSNGKIIWSWEDSSGTYTLTSVNAITLTGWYHIAVSFLSDDGSGSGLQTMYINAATEVTGTSSGILQTNSDSLIFGQGFTGKLDEVRFYNEGLDQSVIANDMDATHSCSLGALSITASTTANHCSELLVTINVLDNSGNILTGYTGDISLSTSTGAGTWTASSSSITNPDSPNGTFADAISGDGLATYTFDTLDEGSISLFFVHDESTAATLYAANLSEGIIGATDPIDFSGDTEYFTFTEDPITVAGRPQTTTIQAMNASCGVDTNYSGLTVSSSADAAYRFYMWLDRNGELTSAAAPTLGTDNNSGNIIVCATQTDCSLPDNGTTFDAATATAVTLEFDADSKASFMLETTDVGQYQLYAQHTLCTSFKNNGDCKPNSLFTSSGVSQQLTVAPFGFDLDFGDDRANNGTTGNSYSDLDIASPATNTTVFTTAGSNFIMDITAVQWQQTDDSDDDGVPDSGVNLTDNTPTTSFGLESTAADLTFDHSLAAPSGGAVGTLSSANISSSNFTNGVASATMNWSEVGIINITANLPSYLGGSTSIDGAVDNVGRFIPASFSIASSAGSYANVHAGGTNFTYIGQSFGYSSNPVITVTALNSSGLATTNYTGSFTFLAEDEITLSLPTIDAGSGLAIDGGSNFGTLSAPVDNGDGSLSFTLSGSSIFYQKTATVIAPFTANLPITISAINETTDSISTISGTTTFTPTGNLQRYGRATLADVYGGSDSILSMPFATEYYDGTNWVNNSSDDLSTAVTANSNTSCSSSDFTCAVDLLISGTATSGATASTLTLTPTTHITGEATIALTAPGWLTFDWDANSTLDFASAKATFGIFRGDDRFFYWRERR